MISHYLLLIANSNSAEIYTVNFKDANLEYKTSLTHPESKEKGINLMADRPGHYKTEHGSRGAFQDRTEPKEHEKIHFAKQLAEYLSQSLKENVFANLVIITPSHFWGLLDNVLPESVKKSVIRIIQKDYTHFSENEIIDVLRNEKLFPQKS